MTDNGQPGGPVPTAARPASASAASGAGASLDDPRSHQALVGILIGNFLPGHGGEASR
jgi:hypothetical protein